MNCFCLIQIVQIKITLWILKIIIICIVIIILYELSNCEQKSYALVYFFMNEFVKLTRLLQELHRIIVLNIYFLSENCDFAKLNFRDVLQKKTQSRPGLPWTCLTYYYTVIESLGIFLRRSTSENKVRTHILRTFQSPKRQACSVSGPRDPHARQVSAMASTRTASVFLIWSLSSECWGTSMESDSSAVRPFLKNSGGSDVIPVSKTTKHVINRLDARTQWRVMSCLFSQLLFWRCLWFKLPLVTICNKRDIIEV